MPLNAYTELSGSISEADERRCNLMYHVFIQWLARENVLDQWLTYIVDRFYTDGYVFYHENIAKYGDHDKFDDIRKDNGIFSDPYDFLNYSMVGPGWSSWTGDDKLEDGDAMHYKWAGIRNKILNTEQWRNF